MKTTSEKIKSIAEIISAISEHSKIAADHLYEVSRLIDDLQSHVKTDKLADTAE